MFTKRKLALVSTRDPLEADDFDDEALEDAKEYNLLRELKAQKGQKGKKGMAKAKVARARARSLSVKRKYWEDPSEDEASASDDGDGRRTKRYPRNDRDLRYEGQVILDYNPLERMAGLEDKRRHNGNHGDVWSPESDDAGPSSSKVSPNGVKGSAPGALEADEEEGEEQDYEYSDEEVIIPTGTRLIFHKGNRLDDETEEDGGEQEGVYSEDELFAESAPQALPTTPQQMSLVDIDPIRPNFELDFDPANNVPLLLDPAEPDITVPASINRFLKAYQRDGAKFLFSKYRQGMGGVLGDDMGLGKTIQVISFLSAIMRKTGTSEDYRRRKNLIRRTGDDIAPKHWPTAMIICPKFLLKNWQRELDTWGYFETATWQSETWKDTKNSFLRGYLDIILISYETARMHMDAIKEMPISVVIADEAHRLKDPRAAISLALKKIQGAACFALTGTLIQNRIDEMWSVLDFVQRGHAGTIRQWRDFAVNPIKLGHRREGTAEEVVKGIIRLGMMVQKILPRFYLRRDKRLIAHELPIKRDLIVFCPLGNSQVMAYQALIASDDVQFILRRNDPCECGSGETRSHCCHARTAAGEELKEVILKYINALMKVANHLALLYQAKDDNPQTRDVNRNLFKICMGDDYNPREHSAIKAALDPDNCGKWPLLAKLLREWRNEEKADNKVLIFSNSVRLLKMIAEFITTSLSYSFDILTGEVGTDERMDMVDRFQDPNGDMYILLISTMAGGVGLNLTAANKVVIFDPAWNPANDLQAMDRAFRIGQRRTVEVYRLIGQGTLEELMYERQVHKQQRARQINDGTFERRIHQGYEGARGKEEQGELFGTHNIFKFDPNGFMKGNLERVRLAEDQFMQDMAETRYEEEFGSDDEDDEAGAKMRNERKSRDLRKASELARAREQQDAKSVLANVLGEESTDASTQQKDILKQLGVNSHVHEEAFHDSPQERQIYEIGIQLLKSNPELAAKIKANELGRVSKAVLKAERGERGTKPLKQEPADEEPWNSRFETVKRRKGEARAVLAELSD